jgi:hypothetical protein
MKRNILFIALGALVLLGACTKKPWDAVEEGSWNNDRKILNIKFAGQAGLAKVSEVDETTGIIDVSLATSLVTDWSKVAIETLELSYKATSTIQRGGTVDFSGANPTIAVTSGTGKTRTYTINMTEFTETLTGCYAIKTSRVWGGTGPEWGGGALMDPQSKDWCWYTAEGFGPAAEYDDYLEFTMDKIMDDGNTTGKCIHYGGVNGKHWNCLFKAKYNLEGDTDIDLHKFYRQIPVGESTWVRDYVNNTISFYDANGKVTTGEFMDAGDYTVYEGKVLTVEKKAFGFKLSGVDDWTNIYTDYDKFVKRPRLFFVLVEPVDEIPAASKTEGTEGKNTVDPVVPEPEQELDLNGTYSLKRFTVYGRTGGAVFMDPKDKSWNWNNSIWWEGDNKLVLTVASTEGNFIKGEANYLPGNDEKFWDCKWLAEKNLAGTGELDLSPYYARLPRGKSSFVCDKEAGIISFTTMKGAIINTTVANFLTSGTYKFGKNQKELTVDGIAFDFPLQNEDDVTVVPAFQYKDFDALVYAPFNYIMIFKKDEPAE